MREDVASEPNFFSFATYFAFHTTEQQAEQLALLPVVVHELPGAATTANSTPLIVT